jgi:hypothetical protein
MREWSVKSAKKRVENPRVVHYGYEQVFIRQAWCTDRPHSFCEFPTIYIKNECENGFPTRLGRPGSGGV